MDKRDYYDVLGVSKNATEQRLLDESGRRRISEIPSYLFERRGKGRVGKAHCEYRSARDCRTVQGNGQDCAVYSKGEFSFVFKSGTSGKSYERFNQRQTHRKNQRFQRNANAADCVR